MIVTTTAKVISALDCLNEIRGQQIQKQTAKNLYHLRRMMQESVDFFNEQLNEILDQMRLEMKPGGMIEFGDDTEKRDRFMKEIREVEETEAKLDCDPLDLSDEDIRISEKFISGTEGFVIL